MKKPPVFMPQNYWLVKQEPSAFGWSDLLKEKQTAWTGVRNFQARNHLRAMKKGDLVLFYHSLSEKQVVGLARVQREAYPDPTASEGDWSAIDLAAVRSLRNPVSLEAIKREPALSDIPLLRQSRLSVMPLGEKEFQRIIELSERPAQE